MPVGEVTEGNAIPSVPLLTRSDQEVYQVLAPPPSTLYLVVGWRTVSIEKCSPIITC